MFTQDIARVLHDRASGDYIVSLYDGMTYEPIVGIITKDTEKAADAYAEIIAGEPAENINGNTDEWHTAYIFDCWCRSRLPEEVVEIADSEYPKQCRPDGINYATAPRKFTEAVAACFED